MRRLVLLSAVILLLSLRLPDWEDVPYTAGVRHRLHRVLW